MDNMVLSRSLPPVPRVASALVDCIVGLLRQPVQGPQRIYGQRYVQKKRTKEKLSNNSVGANVDEASAGGMESAEAAARLKDLPLDFSEAVESAKNAVHEDPGVPGWGSFEEVHEHHMRNVSYHAENLGENIQGSAYDIAVADLDAAEQFKGSINAPQLY